MRIKHVAILIPLVVLVALAVDSWPWMRAADRIRRPTYDGIQADMTEATVVEWIGLPADDYRLFEPDPHGFVCGMGLEVHAYGPHEADARTLLWQGPHGSIAVTFNQEGRINSKRCKF